MPDDETRNAFVQDIFAEQPDEESRVDFEKILPMPELLRHTSSGGQRFKDPLTGEEVSVRTWYSNRDTKEERMFTPEEEKQLKELGASSWYDWSCNNWGTKWNAYDTRIRDDESVQFDTAWSPPSPWLEALAAKYPEVVFEVSYIDEGWGFACTETYKNGRKSKTVDFDCNRDDEDFRELYFKVYGDYPEPDEEEEEEDANTEVTVDA